MPTTTTHFEYCWHNVSMISISFISALTLSNQVSPKPRLTKYSSSTVEPSLNISSSSALNSLDDAPSDKGVAFYRYRNSNTGATCTLLKADALVEVKFLLHGFEEQADSFVPDKALVDGNCKDEDTSYMSISWTGYSLLLNFAKTPGGERWYISTVVLTVSPDLQTLHGIETNGRPIKLYHKEMTMPTPIGRSYSCDEVDIDLQPDDDEHHAVGLHGSLLLRLMQLQPFMYKGDDFEEAYECQKNKSFRSETAPLAVGLTLALSVVLTISGYAGFRYFKIKNVRYNNME